MKKTLKNLIAFSFLAVLFSACEKDLYDPGYVKEKSIPSDFSWKTTQALNCSVSVADSGSDLLHVVKIYSDSKLNLGSLLAIGSAKPGMPYSVHAEIAATIDKIYVQIISPNGQEEVQSFTLDGNKINVSSGSSLLKMRKTRSVVDMAVPEVTVPESFDVVISKEDDINIIGDKTYFIPAGTTYRQGNMNLANWTGHAYLYVAGTVILPQSKGIDNLTLVVLNGGKVTFGGLKTGPAKTGSTTIYVQKGGEFVVDGNVNISNGRNIVNKGSFSVTGLFDLNNYSSFYNVGTLHVYEYKEKGQVHLTNNAVFHNGGDVIAKKVVVDSNASLFNKAGSIKTDNLYCTNSSVFENYALVLVDDNIEIAGNRTFINACQIFADDIKLSGARIDLLGGSLLVGEEVKSTDNSIFRLEDDALFIFEEIDSSVWGLSFTSQSSQTSVVKCTEEMPSINPSKVNFSGHIEFVYADYDKNKQPANCFTNGATIVKEQTISIAKSECNAGRGSIDNVVDTDGDGVPDDEDAFPDDPDRAFVVYFPSADKWGTYAFEDLWPSEGDYDMNDLILGFNITWVLNANNQMVDMIVKTNPRAVGSGMNIAAAFQLDKLQPNQIKSVSGSNLSNNLFEVGSNGCENLNHPVIPIFDDHRNVIRKLQDGAFWNTVIGGGRMEGIEQEIRISFNTAVPATLSDVQIGNVNMFIVAYNADDVTRKEVHLPAFEPTTKAIKIDSPDLSSSDMYKHKNGMMWGLMFPDTFDYPIEGNEGNLKDAYTHFFEWATSGGTQYQDWYLDKSGYRNSDKIYK